MSNINYETEEEFIEFQKFIFDLCQRGYKFSLSEEELFILWKSIKDNNIGY